MRILIVEDNAELAAALRQALEAREISADVAPNAMDAELMLSSVRYMAMILDLGLPDEDGLALLRRLRGRRDPLPIIVLTARGDVSARISGLNYGADDYVTKPFDTNELHARLLAVLRRQGSYLGQTLSCGSLRFDTETREASAHGQPLSLSSREGELLELLLRNMGRVVPKRLVEDQLFGLDDTLGSNAVEVYVHRLRKRLEQAQAGVQIHTVRGVGYLLKDIQ